MYDKVQLGNNRQNIKTRLVLKMLVFCVTPYCTYCDSLLLDVQLFQPQEWFLMRLSPECRQTSQEFQCSTADTNAHTKT